MPAERGKAGLNRRKRRKQRNRVERQARVAGEDKRGEIMRGFFPSP
jgi:hypothetical protein